jgi:hypothetical protein
MPYHFFGHFGAPNRPRPTHATKLPPEHNIGGCQPIVNGSLNPKRYRDGSNVTGFANQVDDGPVILSTLEMINGQFGQLATP